MSLRLSYNFQLLAQNGNALTTINSQGTWFDHLFCSVFHFDLGSTMKAHAKGVYVLMLLPALASAVHLVFPPPRSIFASGPARKLAVGFDVAVEEGAHVCSRPNVT